MSSCSKCVFYTEHNTGIQMCLALAKLLDNVDEYACNGKNFLEEDEKVDRYEQLLNAMRNLN